MALLSGSGHLSAAVYQTTTAPNLQLCDSGKGLKWSRCLTLIVQGNKRIKASELEQCCFKA